MSSRDISRAEESLKGVLLKILPPESPEVQTLIRETRERVLDELVDAFKDLAEAVADERLDREFNRGDWRG